MSFKNTSKTKTAFLILMLNLVYLALFTVIMLVAGVLEAPCNGDGVYTVFAAISIAMICFYPVFAVEANATSVFFQICALRKGESKVKNILMMVTAVLYTVAVIVWFVVFWRGSMGV